MATCACKGRNTDFIPESEQTRGPIGFQRRYKLGTLGREKWKKEGMSFPWD